MFHRHLVVDGVLDILGGSSDHLSDGVAVRDNAILAGVGALDVPAVGETGQARTRLLVYRLFAVVLLITSVTAVANTYASRMKRKRKNLGENQNVSIYHRSLWMKGWIPPCRSEQGKQTYCEDANTQK